MSPGGYWGAIEKTVGFAVKADMDMMSIHTTTVYPGSRLFEMLTKNGNAHLVQQWDNYAKGVVSMDDLSLMYIPDGLTLKDLQKARKAAYLKFYFRPKIILKQLFKDLSSFKTLRLHARIAWSLLTTGKTSKDYK